MSGFGKDECPALIEVFAAGGGGAGLQGFTLEGDRQGGCVIDKLPVLFELFAAGGGGAGLHGFRLKEDCEEVGTGSDMSPFCL